MTVKTLATGSVNSPFKIGRVDLLGCESPLKWTRDAEGLHINMPIEKPCEHAFVLRITSA